MRRRVRRSRSMADVHGPARVRPAAVRRRDRRRFGSGDARGRARPRATAAGTSRCSPRARAITTPGATSTPPGTLRRRRRRRPPLSGRGCRSRGDRVPRIEERIQARCAGLARRPAGVARRTVPRSRPVPPSRRERRPLRRGDPVAVPVLDHGDRRDGRAGTHDRHAVPPRRAVRVPRGAQSGAVRRRAPVVPVRARARARTPLREAAPPTTSPVQACTCPTSTTRRDSSHGTASTARSSCSRDGARAARAGTGCSRVSFRDPQYNLPFDLVTIGVRPGLAAPTSRDASTTSASSTTTRSPTRSPPRPRTYSRAPTRASRAR